MPTEQNPNKEIDPSFLSIREMLIEVRSDVKELKAETVRLTALPDVTQDHEVRIRRIEVWAYGIPLTGLLALGSVAAVALSHF